MKKRRNIQNINEKTPSKDRYLITYADLLTLLFALFIILYSISKPDSEKLQGILLAMNNVFSPNQIIDGNALSPDVASAETPPIILFPSQPLNIIEMQDNIEKSLSDLIASNTLIFQRIPEGMRLVIPNKFLFASGKATILSESVEMLDSLALIIKPLNMQIQIDGHTDAVPIKSFNYTSNWGLSATRAVNIVEELVKRGVPASNLVARGFADQRPIADNITEEGKEQNRRVEIIITPKDVNVATTDMESIDTTTNALKE
ncbi:MAG: OmpA family protein [Bacteroidetes bacterium]|nr:OmpA family protein [Bacteroidota bacterium]